MIGQKEKLRNFSITTNRLVGKKAQTQLKIGAQLQTVGC